VTAALEEPVWAIEAAEWRWRDGGRRGARVVEGAELEEEEGAWLELEEGWCAGCVEAGEVEAGEVRQERWRQERWRQEWWKALSWRRRRSRRGGSRGISEALFGFSAACVFFNISRSCGFPRLRMVFKSRCK
jgi:hypothetical protein